MFAVEIHNESEAISHGKHCGWCTATGDYRLYTRGRLIVLYKASESGRPKRRPSFQLYISSIHAELKRKGNESCEWTEVVETACKAAEEAEALLSMSRDFLEVATRKTWDRPTMHLPAEEAYNPWVNILGQNILPNAGVRLVRSEEYQRCSPYRGVIRILPDTRYDWAAFRTGVTNERRSPQHRNPRRRYDLLRNGAVRVSVEGLPQVTVHLNSRRSIATEQYELYGRLMEAPDIGDVVTLSREMLYRVPTGAFNNYMHEALMHLLDSIADQYSATGGPKRIPLSPMSSTPTTGPAYREGLIECIDVPPTDTFILEALIRPGPTGVHDEVINYL